MNSEAAKNSFVSEQSTKREGEGVKGFSTKEKRFFCVMFLNVFFLFFFAIFCHFNPFSTKNLGWARGPICPPPLVSPMGIHEYRGIEYGNYLDVEILVAVYLGKNLEWF